MGGGNGSSARPSTEARGLSPRGRGKHRRQRQKRRGGGSIPAWAGETGSLSRWSLEPSVYPRVGGGNRCAPSLQPDVSGLSPRGRGKRLITGRRMRNERSIPAWAGETRGLAVAAAHLAVYPRVGGGNRYAPQSACGLSGLSPRGRGKLQVAVSHRQPPGSIPAWAGETKIAERRRQDHMVYPRVGGGNSDQIEPLGDMGGLSPRGRGKRLSAAGRYAG